MNDEQCQRERLALLQWAMRIYRDKKASPAAAWACLLEWARLGGRLTKSLENEQ